MIFAAPFVSSWLPFYYTSSMAVGVFLVVLIIIFQVSVDVFFLLIMIVLLNSYVKMLLLVVGYEAIAYWEEKCDVSCILRICGEYLFALWFSKQFVSIESAYF